MNKSRNSEIELIIAQADYKLKFGDVFPTMCSSLTEDEMVRTIRECIRKNKPYEVEIPDGAVI